MKTGVGLKILRYFLSVVFVVIIGIIRRLRIVVIVRVMKRHIYAAVMDEIGRIGIQDVLPEASDADDLKQINRFFKTELLPVLSPIVIGSNHPVLHLVNKRLYAAALLENKKGHKAVGMLAEPKSAAQIKNLAESLDLFDFAPGTHTPEDYGKYMIRQSGRFEYDENLDAFYDYEKYGTERMNAEDGMFTDRGYIAYKGYYSMEEVMNSGQSSCMEMGGLSR